MIGHRFGPYLLIAALGEGRLGQMYLGRDERNGRDVAVRVLPEGYFEGEGERRRFRQAALALFRLHHEAIADTLDIVNEDGRDAVVTEYVRGDTLASLLKRGRLPEATAARITRDLAEGLAAAHERNVVHRYLNPRNVIVQSDGRVKIMDFGLPRSASSGDSPLPAGAPRPPIDRLVYAAPEQLTGTRGDGRSDLYSLGVMFYEMLTGERPHDSPDAASLAYEIAHVPAPPPSRFHRQLSRPLEDIVLASLEKDPSQRYLSGHDLAADLRRLEMQGVTHDRDHLMLRADRVWMAIYGLLIVLSIALGLVVGNVGRSRARPPAPRVPRPPPRRTRAGRGRGGVAGSGGRSRERLTDLLYRGRASVLSGEVRSLGVLPLRDLTRDEGTEALGFGLASEVARMLGAVHAIKVVGPVSAGRVRVDPDSLPQLGRALLVDVVVSGTVSHAGPNLLRMSLRARQCATERLVWSRTSEARFDEAEDLERDMVLSLLRALRVATTNDEELHIGRTRPVDIAAYTAYLGGRTCMQRGDAASLGTATDYLKRSVKLDSSYVPAWAALSSLELLARRGDWQPPDPGACARITTASLRALSIDASNGEAHAAYGYALWRCDHQMKGAEQHFRAALAAQPGDPLGRAAFAVFLGAQDRFEQRLVQTRRAMELDPMSPAIHVDLARCYLYVHEFDRALRQCHRALELEPRDPNAWAALARAQAANGDWSSALSSQRTADSLGAPPSSRWLQLRAAVAAGQRVQALKLWRPLQELIKLGEVDPFQAAVGDLTMGDIAGATSWLAHGLAEGTITAQDLKMAPELDALRSDERFNALLARAVSGDPVDDPPR